MIYFAQLPEPESKEERRKRLNREYAKARRAANPEKYRAYQQAHRKANPEKYRAYSRDWRAENPEKSRESQKAHNAANREKRRALAKRVRLNKAYKLSPEQVDEMISGQGGRCLICRTMLNPRSRQLQPCVDHCHSTGVIRGVLCRGCNTGLGTFLDNPRLLIAAARYLKRFAPSSEG